MRLRTGLAALPALLLLTGCYLNVKSHDHDDEHHPQYTPPPYSNSYPVATKAERAIPYDECRESANADHFALVCKNEGADRWWTNCREGSCRQLPVTVHYLVAKNLGTSSQVRVEAFDNPNFRGAPSAVALLAGFDTSRVGTFRQDELFVEPGEYFVRAYVVPETGATTPYEYGGMTLVAGSPVGVYGAASGAANAVVSDIAWEAPKPVEISLDRLFEDPRAKPSSEARLRVMINLAAGVKAAGPAKVLVDVSSHQDFAFKSEYRFEVSGDQFRVGGREGKAELLTPDLAPGTYYVRAFLDDSANGFLDRDEASALLGDGGTQPSIAVIEKRTAEITMTLTAPAEAAAAAQ